MLLSEKLVDGKDSAPAVPLNVPLATFCTLRVDRQQQVAEANAM